MRIVYCIAGTRHSGGMERVLANKANWLATHGYDVIIVTTDQHGEKPFFHLDSAIKCYDLAINYENNNGKSFFNKALNYPFKQLRHRYRLSSLLKTTKADIVISMFCNDASFLPNINDGSAKILEIHFSRFKRLQYNRCGIWHIADTIRSKNDTKTVARYDKFVVLTQEDQTYWGCMPNITAIPNANSFHSTLQSTLQSKRVLAIGRLTHQKGFDLLIDAWKLVCERNNDWTLTIAGDGPLKDQLRQQINKYNLHNRVELIGAVKNIEQLYTESSIYALSSRYEGLPMVLLEAQSAGLPIVAFQCKCGPKDVITDGVDGYLVEEEDLNGFAERLLTLIDNPTLRTEFGIAAHNNSKYYDETTIMHRWESLFEDIRPK